MIMSTLRENPQIAPSRMPMVMLMAAHMTARDTEIREPFHTESNVDAPVPPAPNSHFISNP